MRARRQAAFVLRFGKKTREERCKWGKRELHPDLNMFGTLRLQRTSEERMSCVSAPYNLSTRILVKLRMKRGRMDAFQELSNDAGSN